MIPFGLPFRLARRELRAGLKGFRIFLMCLVIGVAAIAAVQSVSAGLMESLRYSGRYVLGGDVAIRTIYDPMTKAQAAAFKKGGPMSVVAQTRAMTRDALSENTLLVELKAVDAFYPLYAGTRIVDETGRRLDDPERIPSVQDFLFPQAEDTANPQAALWGALVEAEVLERLDLKLGDVLTIGTLPLQLRGIIEHEPDKISMSKFALGPRLMISMLALPQTGLMQKGSQIYYDHRVILPPGRDLVEFETEMTEAFPDAGWQMRDFTKAAPNVERFIKRLNLFLTLTGLTALLVGGVGVSNAVQSYLSGRVRTIATLKCLGASGALIFRTYFLQIAALATLGIVLGVVIGALAPLAAGPFLTAKLAIENRMGVYPQSLGIAALFGYLVAFGFSLWPLARAQQISPADLFRQMIAPVQRRPALKYIILIFIFVEALALLAVMTSEDRGFALWFVLASILAVGVFVLAAFAVRLVAGRFTHLRHPGLRFALSNLHRPGNRTSSIVLSLGLGISVMVAIAMVEGNFSSTLTRNLNAKTPSFFFIDIQPHQLIAFKQALADVPTVRETAFTPSLRGRITAVNGVDAQTALIDPRSQWLLNNDRGFTYTDSLPDFSEVVAGEWWPENYKGPPLVSISQDVADGFGVGPGDEITVTIVGKEISATIANVREVQWDSFTMNFAVTFAPGALEAAPKTYIGTTVVDEDQEITLQKELSGAFPNVSTVRVRDALQVAVSLLENVVQAVRIGAAVALISGTFVLAGAVAAGHRQRVYDAVVLKVLGATRRRIMTIFLLEYGVLGLVVAAIACLIGAVSSWAIFTHIMDMRWVFLPAAMIWTAVICTGLTLALGFIGTALALRNKAAPLLRNE